MSFESTRKGRQKIVQKLDFENCIVTNIKTTARGRKRLRARITREFQQISDISDEPEEEILNTSRTQNSRPPSPVLISKKKTRNLLTKRKKCNTPEKLPEDLTINETSTPGSPVFKTFKKQKTTPSPGVSGLDISSIQGNLSPDAVSSYQIEDFTQESKQSVRISSVESPTLNTSSSCSGQTNPACQYRSESNPFMIIRETVESPRPVRRNYKKKSLLGRLEKLKKKQASEKLLFQHQRTSTGNLKLCVVSLWKEEFNYFFKCCSSFPSDFDATYVIIDSRWVPQVRHVKEGAVLQLHPPWQKLTVEESAMTVFLNVICLDILEETEEPTQQEKAFEVVPVNRFEIDQKLFINSLFFSWSSGLLY